jgi:hypothetical protein
MGSIDQGRHPCRFAQARKKKMPVPWRIFGWNSISQVTATERAKK